MNIWFKLKILSTIVCINLLLIICPYINISYAKPSTSVYSKKLNAMQDTSDVKETHHIVGCVRTIHSAEEKGKPTSKDFVDHCFLKFVRAVDNATVDSRGFFGDVGSAQEDSTIEGTCALIKQHATMTDWQQVVDVYGQYTHEDYKLTSQNCCTVATEAARAVAADAPPIISNANSSIGTRWKPKDSCVVQ